MKSILIICAIALFSVLQGCVIPRYIYSASKLNTHYLKKKMDTKVSVEHSFDNGSRDQKARGFDFQGALAITDHWAVTGSYGFTNEHDKFGKSDDFDTSVMRYRRHFTEVGLGYFAHLNPKQTITANIFAGIAFGKFLMNEHSEYATQSFDFYHNVPVTKYFIQPSINFQPGKYMRFALIIRPTFVRYGSLSTNFSENQLSDFHLNVNRTTVAMMENNLNFQFGLPEVPWLKVDFTVAYAETSSSLRYDYYVRNNCASVGLSFDFHKMRRKNRARISTVVN